MRSPVASPLADLGAGLETLGVSWYLFGARAAILHGVARLTADVDVTVRLPAQVSSRSVVDRDSLDVDDVRQTLGAVETALGQSDLKPVFEAALARARRP